MLRQAFNFIFATGNSGSYPEFDTAAKILREIMAETRHARNLESGLDTCSLFEKYQLKLATVLKNHFDYQGYLQCNEQVRLTIRKMIAHCLFEAAPSYALYVNSSQFGIETVSYSGTEQHLMLPGVKPQSRITWYFPGTLFLQPEELAKVLKETFISAKRLILNATTGNKDKTQFEGLFQDQKSFQGTFFSLLPADMNGLVRDYLALSPGANYKEDAASLSIGGNKKR